MTLFQAVVASGWPCFPLRAGTKIPAIPSAHPVGDPKRGICKGECGNPGHGVLDATTKIPDGAQVAVDGVAGVVRWIR